MVCSVISLSILDNGRHLSSSSVQAGVVSGNLPALIAPVKAAAVNGPC